VKWNADTADKLANVGSNSLFSIISTMASAKRRRIEATDTDSGYNTTNSTELLRNVFDMLSTYEHILKGKAIDYSVGLNETIYFNGFAGMYFRTPLIERMAIASCSIMTTEQEAVGMAIEIP